MLICEGLFFIFGLIALISGKLRLVGKRTTIGNRARIAGAILMIPGPLALLIGFVLGVTGGATSEAIAGLSVFEALLLVGAFVAAIIISLTAPASEAPGNVVPVEQKVYTVAEAATYLRVSEPELLQLIESGELPAGKVGEQYRIEKEALINFLKSK